MKPAAVTLDFWNTLVDSSGGEYRNIERQRLLREAMERSGYRWDHERCGRIYRELWGWFDVHWLETRRTPDSEEMVDRLCSELDVVLPGSDRLGVIEGFERGVLNHPPALLPGVLDGITFLAARTRLAVISDTAFSPGTVLREFLHREGIGQWIGAWSFSNETGVAKPDPRAFDVALGVLGVSPGAATHIGDIERTDVRGAQAVGMRAVLYRGDSHPHKYAEEETCANAILENWGEIEEVWRQLEGTM